MNLSEEPETIRKTEHFEPKEQWWTSFKHMSMRAFFQKKSDKRAIA